MTTNITLTKKSIFKTCLKGILIGLIVVLLNQINNTLLSFNDLFINYFGPLIFIITYLIFHTKKNKDLVLISFLLITFLYLTYYSVTDLILLFNNSLAYSVTWYQIILVAFFMSLLIDIIIIPITLLLSLARKKNIIGNYMKLLPIIYIINEEILIVKNLINNHASLFMLILDLVCLILYIYLFRDKLKYIFKMKLKYKILLLILIVISLTVCIITL